jgi:hypothetical protein
MKTYTIIELIEIFPESREIVPTLLRSAVRRHNKILRDETIPYLNKCLTIKDEFSRAFWRETYHIMAGEYNASNKKVQYLRRLAAIMKDPEGYGSFQAKIEAAKSTRIEDLHDFQGMRRVGRSTTAKCPLHNDKGPSFKIYPGNTYHCFGCGAGGDSINFIMRLHKMTFKQAINYMTGDK